MNTAKNRSQTVALAILGTVIANAILFTGLPLLTQIERGFRERGFDRPTMIAQFKPPPPPRDKEKQLKEKKPKKIQKKKQLKKQTARPKIDLPKFQFALGGGLTGGLQIAMGPRDGIKATFRTAFTLAEVDQPPRVIRRIDPLYPFAAKRKQIEGTVTLRFIVTKDGRVEEPSVVDAEPLEVFDNSALKAILRWRFRPAVKDGQNVDVIVIAPLKFNLEK